MSDFHPFWNGVYHEIVKAAHAPIVGTSVVQPMQGKLRQAAPNITSTINIRGTQQMKSPVAKPK